MSKFELPIGSYGVYRGIPVRCEEELLDATPCHGFCPLKRYCCNIACDPSRRKDGKYVVYVAVGEKQKEVKK